MEQDYAKLQKSLITIASEMFRLRNVFENAISKLEIEERNKYQSQFAWFSKRVYKALDDANLKILNLDGQIYDPGMAVTPINIDDFECDDPLCIIQTLEPIIMKNNSVCKTGTVVLGRVEK